MTQAEIYKSVLKKLSDIPVDKLIEVDKFLETLKDDASNKEKEERRQKILSFAGSWNDMEQEDFDDYLDSIKQLRKNSFNREIDL